LNRKILAGALSLVAVVAMGYFASTFFETESGLEAKGDVSTSLLLAERIISFAGSVASIVALVFALKSTSKNKNN